jgi:fructose-bisphosphate aldolase, class I
MSQMNNQVLIDAAKALMACDKGLLAMDESSPTCNKRFAELNIPQTEEARRTWRELILTTPNLGEYVSGVILYDETIRQHTKDGTSFVKLITDKGILAGIKVDIGAKDMAGYPGEKITEGLDGLRDRLTEYAQMGARFAKWRAVITIGDAIPSHACIEVNAQALARYAALCQETGLVPIIEAEVLMDGAHTIERCNEVTKEVLHTVFNQLYQENVLLEGLILKPNMVLSGLSSAEQVTVDEVADATMKCLLRAVPAAVPGIAFLSGGQSAELASSRLNAMNKKFRTQLPWALTFSFSRAIQQGALEIWHGEDANVMAAQKELLHRVKCNHAARRGEYSLAIEVDHKNNLMPSAFDASRFVSRQKKFVVANWKMYTNTIEARHLARAVVNGVGSEKSVNIVICPPFPYLALVGDILSGSTIELGSQNLFPKKEGAFTGEISPTMLLDVGCKYVILGHSERRGILGESDAFINQKVLAALAAGLTVIFCIGETLDQREAKQTNSTLGRQIAQGLESLPLNALARLIIAYEPVWAIGSGGHQASPQQIEEEQLLIREQFSQMFGKQAAQMLPILYGGSVNPENASSFLNQHGIDGVLIGADSLNAEQFVAIVQSGASVSQINSSSRISREEYATK